MNVMSAIVTRATEDLRAKVLEWRTRSPSNSVPMSNGTPRNKRASHPAIDFGNSGRKFTSAYTVRQPTPQTSTAVDRAPIRSASEIEESPIDRALELGV